MKNKIAISLSVFLIMPMVAESSEVRLAGHRAVYELSFDSAETNSGVIGAEGRYVFDLEDACEGYALNERLVVKIARTEDTILTDYRLSAFESSDGTEYRFATQTDFNGRTGQEAEGNLSVDLDGETAEVDYDGAEDVSFDHPVLAPVSHVRAVIEAAIAGEDRHAAMIFDGDTNAPIYYAATRISEVEKDETIKGTEDLAELGRWKIDSVYFPPETGGEGDGATPDFAFSATIFENGVVADLRLDYSEFALKATMSDLELHQSGC